MCKSKTLLLVCAVVLLFTHTGISQSRLEGWTQFRGPNRAGISPEKIHKQDWQPNDIKLVWKKKIGSSFSEVLVTDDVVYTMKSIISDSVTGYEYVAAINKDNGTEIWSTKVDSIYFDEDGWGDGSRATPLIHEDKIYCFSGHGKLSAISLADGEMLWQVDFVKQFGSTTPRWGFASSPIFLDNTLVMEVGGTDNHAFAGFNPKNGEVIWSSGNGPASHDSPLKVEIDGQVQIIFANGRTLYSYKPNGDTLWTYTMPFGGITAMPVIFENNKIFASGVRNPGFFIIEVVNNKPNELIKGSSMKNDYSSCVYHNGYIYGFHVAAVRCISAETGEVAWTKRGFGKGSLMLVDNNLFILSDKGKLAIAKATPDAYTELTSIQAIEGKSWTAPSYYNGKVYVRNLTEIACYSVY